MTKTFLVICYVWVAALVWVFLSYIGEIQTWAMMILALLLVLFIGSIIGLHWDLMKEKRNVMTKQEILEKLKGRRYRVRQTWRNHMVTNEFTIIETEADRNFDGLVWAKGEGLDACQEVEFWEKLLNKGTAVVRDSECQRIIYYDLA